MFLHFFTSNYSSCELVTLIHQIFIWFLFIEQTFFVSVRCKLSCFNIGKQYLVFRWNVTRNVTCFGLLWLFALLHNEMDYRRNHAVNKMKFANERPQQKRNSGGDRPFKLLGLPQDGQSRPQRSHFNVYWFS